MTNPLIKECISLIETYKKLVTEDDAGYDAKQWLFQFHWETWMLNLMLKFLIKCELEDSTLD